MSISVPQKALMPTVFCLPIPTGLLQESLVPISFQQEAPMPTGLLQESLVPISFQQEAPMPTGLLQESLVPISFQQEAPMPTGLQQESLVPIFSAGSTHAHWSPTGITRAHLFQQEAPMPTGLLQESLVPISFQQEAPMPTGLLQESLMPISFQQEAPMPTGLLQESLVPISFLKKALVPTICLSRNLSCLFLFHRKHSCPLFFSFILFSTGSTRANWLLTGITHAFSFQQEAFAPTIFFFNKKHPCPVDSYRNYFLQETLVPTGFPQKSPLKSSKWKHKCLYHIFIYLMSRWMFKRKFYAKQK